MKRRTKGTTIVLFISILFVRLTAQQPFWRVELRDVGYQFEEPDTALKFYGQFLVVYSGSIYSHSMHQRLVFAQETGRVISQDHLTKITLPPWDECRTTIIKRAFPALNIIDCRNQMTLEQIGGIGRASEKGTTEYYLQEAGKEKVLLFKGHCNATDPRFVGDNQIFLHPCGTRDVVVNKRGQRLYRMPRLVDPYIALNREGTRFVVHDRDQYLLGQFNDTSNRKRVTVFRSSDGSKIFEYRWRQVDGDGLNDGRAALSDNGTLVALIQGSKLLVFVIPLKK